MMDLWTNSFRTIDIYSFRTHKYTYHEPFNILTAHNINNFTHVKLDNWDESAIFKKWRTHLLPIGLRLISWGSETYSLRPWRLKPSIRSIARFLPYRNRAFWGNGRFLPKPYRNRALEIKVGRYDHFVGESQLFIGDPQIIIGDPQLFIETPDFRCRPQDFHWRPKQIHWRPQIFF